jgi:hypothetical protein
MLPLQDTPKVNVNNTAYLQGKGMVFRVSVAI